MTSQDNANKALAKVIAFNDILSPLMLAIAKDVGIMNNKECCDVETLLMAKMVENVMLATSKYVEKKGIEDDMLKWTVACNIARIAAANYKKTKDSVSLENDFKGINLEEEISNEKISFSSPEDFKNHIFEAVSNIVNAVTRFNFALDEKKIISGAEKQISIYANNLFNAVDRNYFDAKYLNGLYIKTVKNLAELFNTCYYNSIDATLAVPKEKRESFIQKHMVDSSDSIEKTLDGFFARVSIISNISVSLNVPLGVAVIEKE